MKDILQYKDFIGSVHFSAEDGVFFGKIEGIRCVIHPASDRVDHCGPGRDASSRNFGPLGDINAIHGVPSLADPDIEVVRSRSGDRDLVGPGLNRVGPHPGAVGGAFVQGPNLAVVDPDP